MPFISNKSIFTPSGTVFSKFIAVELLSETWRNKWRQKWRHTRHSDITLSVVIRISVYTILCKYGGHSVSHFKVTWRGGLLKSPPSQKIEKKPGLNRVKVIHKQIPSASHFSLLGPCTFWLVTAIICTVVSLSYVVPIFPTLRPKVKSVAQSSNETTGSPSSLWEECMY